MTVFHKDKNGVLFKGDCLEIMKLIPDNSIDLIVTDPPYLMNYKTGRLSDKQHRFTKTILNDDNNEKNKQLII